MLQSNKEPAFKKTNDYNKIIQLVNERLLNKPLSIQLPSLIERHCEIIKAAAEGVAVNFKNFIPPKTNLTISGFIDNFYTEIEVKILKPIQQSFYLCKVNYLRISSQRRMEPRYSINNDTDIYVRKIRISKNELAIDKNNIPVSFKLIMERYKKNYNHLGDIVNIDIFQKISDSYPEIYKEISKTGKSLYIADSNKNESFVWDDEKNEDLIDLRTLYKFSFDSEREKIISNGTIGWIICPILAPVTSDIWTAIGYIEIISKSPIDLSKLMDVKTLSFEIVEKLRDLSIIEIKEKQRILDVSKSGLKLYITNNELINIMLHRPEFIFDIIIKGQAPITVMGLIRMTRQLEDGTLQVGIKIQGETNRQNQMVRYLEFIESLAKDPKYQNNT